MIQLISNGEESTLDVGDFTSVGEAIAQYTGGPEKVDLVLTRLCLDGREVPEEEWDEARGLTLDGIHALEIEATPVDEVARRSLHEVSEYGPRVRDALVRVVDGLRRGETQRACALYATSLDAISVVLFAVNASAARFAAEAESLAGMDAALLPWLKELADSQEREDWVSVADLLEFELIPLLEGWFERIAEVDHRLASETSVS
ncbi:MAG: hypothetical protein ACQGVK_01665 [Myxococcota bacterium]